MVHRDSLGNEDAVTNGGIQWMTAGSGILHEEKLPPVERLFGVQLWLNMKKEDIFAPPVLCGDRKRRHPGDPLRRRSRQIVPRVRKVDRYFGKAGREII